MASHAIKERMEIIQAALREGIQEDGSPVAIEKRVEEQALEHPGGMRTLMEWGLWRNPTEAKAKLEEMEQQERAEGLPGTEIERRIIITAHL